MAGNVFDQFDGPGKQATAPANVFDQFDQVEPKPKQPVDISNELMQPLYGFNKGVASFVTAPYRTIDWIGEKLTGGDFLPNTEDPNVSIWGEYMNPPEAQTTAGRYAAAGGEVMGGSAIPAATLVGLAPRLAALTPTTVPRAIGQSIGGQVAAAPGATLALDAASSATSGFASEAASDAGAGPTGQALAGLAGAFAPAGAFSMFDRTRRAMQGVRFRGSGEESANNKFIERLPGTVDEFADDISRGAGGAGVNTNRRTLDILGEEMQRSGGNRVVAQQQTLDRIVQEFGVAPSTARQNLRNLTNMNGDSNLMLAEASAVRDSNTVLRSQRNPELRDVARTTEPPTQDLIDYLGNSAGRSAQSVRDPVMARTESARDEFSSFLQRTLAPRTNQSNGRGRSLTLDDAEILIRDAQRAGNQAYRTAIQQQQPIGPAIDRYLHSVDLRIQGRQSPIANALRRATDIYRDRIQAITDNGQMGPIRLRPVNDLADYINRRKDLQQLIEESRSPLGRATTETRELERFRRVIDSVVGLRNPSWRVANRQWADMRTMDDVLRMSQKLVERAGPEYRQTIRDFSNLAGPAQDMVRLGWIQKQFDKLDNLGDLHDVAKLFTKDQMRNVVGDLFGAQASRDVTRYVRDMVVANRSRGLLKNSATHRRGELQKEMDAETGILAATENANVRGAKNWLLERATIWLRDRRNQPLAQIATTPLRDTAQVAHRLQNMRTTQQHANQLAAPRSTHLPIAPVIGQAIAGRRQ